MKRIINLNFKNLFQNKFTKPFYSVLKKGIRAKEGIVSEKNKHKSDHNIVIFKFLNLV